MTGRAHSESWFREHLFLLARFVRHPRTVGSVAPSSAALARAMIAGLDLEAPVRLVELGPGTGPFSHVIAKKIGPAAKYLAVEIDPVFAQRMQERCPGLECVCASAAELPALAAERGLSPVDHIVSGLPFASLPAAITQQVLDGIERVLRPGGTFTTFQYAHAHGLPPAAAFRRDMSRRLGREPTRRLVVWNLPPAYVLTWQRESPA